MYKIESTLRRGVNLPRNEYDKEKIEEHKREIQEVLAVLNAPSLPLDQNFGAGKRTTMLVDLQDTAKAPGSDTGAPLALPPASPFLYGALTAPRPFHLSQLKPSSLRTFDQPRVRSARAALPGRRNRLEDGCW